ncbi:MAG: hypothetical protein QOF02_6 [Blastocatellia bacterium]|jgi:hypothetical protein|nr:hypothetical protein [Blastocatellia bacterium]
MNWKLARTAHIFLLIFGAAAFCAAQTSPPGDRAQAPASPDNVVQSANRTNADETFDLNITERRITERDFAASTSVEVGEETARGLLLRVGVGVGADEIDVLLRNVRGHVRFRASLARVLERLNVRRAPAAVP